MFYYVDFFEIVEVLFVVNCIDMVMDGVYFCCLVMCVVVFVLFLLGGIFFVFYVDLFLIYLELFISSIIVFCLFYCFFIV